MVLNIGQAFKMAWRSICGKKGRSALTILSIFIGIAAVMTIVSTMEGMKAKTMEQFAAMGANRIEVSVYAYMYDEGGNPISKDYFAGIVPLLLRTEGVHVLGITPQALIQRHGGIRYEKQLHNGVEI
ncbi:MAG: ABC transporter permease [Dysosmobacter sp.]